MKYKIILKTILLCCVITFTSCTNESTDVDIMEEEQGMSTGNGSGSDPGNDSGTDDILCQGNASDTYFPLAVGNYWKWEWPFSVGQSVADITAEVIGTFDHNGQTYYELTYTGTTGAYRFKYLREDQQGNLKVLVLFEDPSTSTEFYEEHTVIPNTSLSSGSQWDFYGFAQDATNPDFVLNYVQRVASTSTTLETDFCTYTQGLEIFTRVINSLGDETVVNYKVYKRGLGIINYEGNVLTEVILN